MLAYIRSWKEWSIYHKGNIVYKLSVLLGLIRSPSFAFVLNVNYVNKHKNDQTVKGIRKRQQAISKISSFVTMRNKNEDGINHD